MPVRKRTDRRRDGMPVNSLRRIWELWQQPALTAAEENELDILNAECVAAGYDPLLAWCSSQP